MLMERRRGRQKKRGGVIGSNMKWVGVIEEDVEDRVLRKLRTEVADPK